MATRQPIAVLIGSTRPTRICADIAKWACDILNENTPLAYELIDLAEINLPFLDEPFKPTLRRYEHQHTHAWSRLIERFSGFIFVFPQYNWGYPAVLKNALDYLYSEWNGKPASLVAYGTHGGSKGAQQLIDVLQGLHMRVIEAHVEAVITDADVDASWQLIDVESTLQPVRAQLTTIDSQMREALKGKS